MIQDSSDVLTDINPLLVETMVNTLLQIGERVVEISNELIVTRIWDREDSSLRIGANKYLGKKFSELGNDIVFAKCAVYVEEYFQTGKTNTIKYSTINEGLAVTYNLRLINSHPDKDHVFFVVERVTHSAEADLVEDKWKLALEATGDALWDVNLETGAVFFSDQWCEMFGYTQGQITNRAVWYSKVHPDDIERVHRRTSAYLEGREKAYSAELRFQCNDGAYKWILSRGLVMSWGAEGKPQRFIGTHTDINDLKITEGRYHAMNGFLTNLINNLRCGIFVSDENSKIVYANQYFCDLYDYKHGPEILIGQDVRDDLEMRKTFFVEAERFKSRTNEIIAGKAAAINEEWVLKSGRIFSRDYIPISLADGKVGGLWILDEITEQKNAERRFEEQRNFYEEVLNSIKADIAVYDGEERYLYVNPTAIRDEEMRKWLVGKTDEDYLRARNRPQAQLEKRREVINRARTEKKTIQWEEKLINREDAVEYHLRNFYPIFDDAGNMKLGIGYGLNITDRVLAREELQTSMETFSSAFNHSAIGMALISPDGRWIDMNQILCETLGYSKEELLRSSPHEITYVEDFSNDAPSIRKMLSREIISYSIEKRFISKANKIVLLALTVSLVWNVDGTPRFFIVQAVDITKKKELENGIIRKQQELEATKVNLINKIAQLEELSHIIAHNLRGPANNIKMLSEAMIEKLNADETGIVNSITEAFSDAQILDLIKQSAHSLLDSLATLIEVTEIKLNKEIPFNDCDIAAIINDIIGQLHSNIYEKSAIIKLDIQVGQVSYPKIYLENIFYNLISNSLKYTSKNTAPEILINTERKDDKICIRVKDNGLGIDLKRYKDRLFKLNQVFHEGYDSKGIGLYITKTQVESLGGTIEVTSAQNEGCEFIVTL